MVHKRVIAPTRTSSLIGKLDRPHAYQFIDRVLNGAQAGALVLDKLALLVLSTNRFQYIPFQYIPRRARWRTIGCYF